jgi:hypothetical protein
VNGSSIVRCIARGRFILQAVALAAIASCQRPFDAQSQIQTLRVIAVRMDHPIPAPDSDVTIEMLPFDGSPNAKRPDGTSRPIEIAWLGGCFDPAGDLYYACYEGLGSAQDALAAGTPHPFVSRATTFTLHIPADIVSRRQAKGSAPYGLSYVFYAACAGKIVPVRTKAASTPPLSCLGDDGQPASADAFVYGYLPIYTYPGVANQNPIVNGGLFDRRKYDATCAVDGDCDSGQVCGSSKLCLPVVARCDSSRCPEHQIWPTVDVAASTEPNPVTSFVAKEPRNELLYVQYMTNHGSIGGDTRTIVDVRGPHPTYEAVWQPPDTGVGETRIWAIVHDDRGGVTWWWQDVVVR